MYNKRIQPPPERLGVRHIPPRLEVVPHDWEHTNVPIHNGPHGEVMHARMVYVKERPPHSPVGQNYPPGTYFVHHVHPEQKPKEEIARATSEGNVNTTVVRWNSQK
jgi:hypothetical protein